jgi:phosphoadenosine phosphosulfate reductase
MTQTILIRDTGFGPDDWQGGFVGPDNLPSNDDDRLGIDLPSTADVRALAARLPAVPMIRVDFPAFNDGRGFTIARLLRAMGYRGRLRARGHVLPDQYAMARRAGFDEVEITADHAARHPEPHWRARADWRAHDYRARLRA